MIFFGEFILIYPLITIMYGQYGHVDAAGIGIILAVGTTLSVILEIPTGIIADKVPRKYVLMASIFCKILALTTWLIAPFFAGYLIAATLFAFSTALESGTLQAYLYGVLGDKHKQSFGKFWARVSAMVLISYTVAYVFATLVGVRYALLIALSIIPCIVALGICLTLPSDKLTSDSTDLKPRIFASAVGHIKSSPNLLKLIISGVVVVAMAKVMIEYITLYFNQVGVPARWVPIVMAIAALLGAITFWMLHHWEKWLDRWLLVLIVVFTLVLIVSFMAGTVGAVVGMILFTRFIRLLQVQYESNVQHLASNKARATISSIGSFASSLIAAGAMALIGLTAVDNIVVRPIRIFLITGTVVYFVLQLFSRRQRTYNQSAKVNA